LTLITAVWAFYAWPWISGALTIPWDSKNHFYPMLRFLAASLASGQSPDWSPYHLAGHPMVADPQSLIFSPPYRLLASLVPVPTFQHQDAVELGVLLAGGLGLLLFLRERGWGNAAGTLAALVFMFGGPASARLQHVGQILSYAAIPFALWAAERLAARPSLASGLLMGVTGALLVLGRDQVALLGCYLVAAYLMVRLLRGPGRRAARIKAALLPAAAGLIAAGALLAVPLGLTLAFAAMSNRPEIGFDNASLGSLHPGGILSAVVPDLFDARGSWERYWGPGSPTWWSGPTWLDRSLCELYAGVVPLALIATGLFSGGLRRADGRFFLLALVAAALFALGRNTPAFRLLYDLVPGVDLFRRPADATFHLNLCLAVLAGYSLHRCLTRPLKPLPALVSLAALLGLVMVGGSLASALGRLDGALGALLRAAALILAAHLLIFLVPRAGQAKRFAALGLLAFAGLDVAWFNTASGLNSEPPSLYAAIDPLARDPVAVRLQELLRPTGSPTRRDRVEIVGLGGPWQNAPQALGLEATLGYNPLRWGPYQRTVAPSDNSHHAVHSFTPLFPGFRAPLPHLLGLRYIAATRPVEAMDPSLRPGDLPLLATIGKVFIYENPGALPRVLFATDWVHADFEQMIATGDWPTDDPTRTLALEEAPTIVPTGPGAFPTIVPRLAILDYRNTEVTIEVETGRAGFLVLNDLWNPWWRASIDGEPAPVLRANVLFRAVSVPAGRHVVRFRFEPVRTLWRTFSAKLQ